jgi:hypothetical protein
MDFGESNSKDKKNKTDNSIMNLKFMKRAEQKKKEALKN